MIVLKKKEKNSWTSLGSSTLHHLLLIDELKPIRISITIDSRIFSPISKW